MTITVPEFMRRMKDMAALSGEQSMFGSMPVMYTLSINANHPLTAKVLANPDESQQQTLVKQLYDLALLSQNMLTGAGLTAFVKRSVEQL